MCIKGNEGTSDQFSIGYTNNLISPLICSTGAVELNRKSLLGLLDYYK